MKNKTHAHLRAALAALALGASTSVGLCQATDWLQTFDTDTSTAPLCVPDTKTFPFDTKACDMS